MRAWSFHGKRAIWVKLLLLLLLLLWLPYEISHQEKQHNNTITTYNLLSTCCGLGILYPSWSKFAIFLPAILGNGKPPTLKWKALHGLKCFHLRLSILYHCSSFSSDCNNLKWLGNYDTQSQNRIPRRVVTWQSRKSHREELRRTKRANLKEIDFLSCKKSNLNIFQGWTWVNRS